MATTPHTFLVSADLVLTGPDLDTESGTAVVGTGAAVVGPSSSWWVVTGVAPRLPGTWAAAGETARKLDTATTRMASSTTMPLLAWGRSARWSSGDMKR